ncbi:hypothetical protein ACH4UM_34200 [Streptomyces sp. NPDC020801]|uniref:hypothetical protein n=1 Tax=unclassified Streptomyces TaxID=2593676 RepID=UPI0037AD6A06
MTRSTRARASREPSTTGDHDAHRAPAREVCTHSLVAFRLTLVSDTSVDVAMVLRDVTMPLPMRADWGEDLEWPYPGLPAAVVAEFGASKHA